uniref:Uncharacterized protein n=1 Tax=Glossina austeni TaxID=7395 RepID=A0A1A9VI88_GLOAU
MNTHHHSRMTGVHDVSDAIMSALLSCLLPSVAAPNLEARCRSLDILALTKETFSISFNALSLANCSGVFGFISGFFFFDLSSLTGGPSSPSPPYTGRLDPFPFLSVFDILSLGVTCKLCFFSRKRKLSCFSSSSDNGISPSVSSAPSSCSILSVLSLFKRSAILSSVFVRALRLTYFIKSSQVDTLFQHLNFQISFPLRHPPQ